MDGVRIKQLKANLGGINQAQLAQLLGVSPNAVARWESGMRRPKLDNLVPLSAHGVSLEWLAGNSDDFCRPGATFDSVASAVKARLELLEAQTQTA